MLSLNPLHCGAVVASGGRRGAGDRQAPVLIPFIAGQWSLHGLDRHGHPGRRVLIPFIAGQWSLPHRRHRHAPPGRVCLNPLHCGAVVASSGHGTGAGPAAPVLIPFIAGQWSLLCLVLGRASRVEVLIPFIAGQWSLLACAPPEAVAQAIVSIPFIAGQWSLRELRAVDA